METQLKPAATLRRVLLAISAATVLTGLAQVLAPATMLALTGATVSATAAHFFAIIGLFMCLFGGLLWQVLRSPAYQPAAVRWAGLQKLGAAVAVALGVRAGIFSALVLGVAGFDLCSGVLILLYLRSYRPAL